MREEGKAGKVAPPPRTARSLVPHGGSQKPRAVPAGGKSTLGVWAQSPSRLKTQDWGKGAPLGGWGGKHLFAKKRKKCPPVGFGGAMVGWGCNGRGPRISSLRVAGGNRSGSTAQVGREETRGAPMASVFPGNWEKVRKGEAAAAKKQKQGPESKTSWAGACMELAQV